MENEAALNHEYGMARSARGKTVLVGVLTRKTVTVTVGGPPIRIDHLVEV